MIYLLTSGDIMIKLLILAAILIAILDYLLIVGADERNKNG